jgi:hypothetical protein
MQLSADLRLQSELSSGGTLESLISKTLHQPATFLPTADERKAFAGLLANTKQWKSLQTFLLWDLEQERPCLWKFMVRFMTRQNSGEIATEIFSDLKEGAGSFDELEELAMTPNILPASSPLYSLRVRALERKKREQLELKSALMDQAQRFGNDRLYDEESQALFKLIKLFPQDEAIREIRAGFAARKAREIIGSRKRVTQLERIEDYLSDEILSPDVRAHFDEIERSLVAEAHRNPSVAYDVAVGLLQMGAANAALESLELAPRTTATEWLRLEVLLETRRFVDALVESDRLEGTFGPDPESVFSARYGKARALWGLKRQPQAIELLTEIVRVRPNFRSAHALLLAWSEAMR